MSLVFKFIRYNCYLSFILDKYNFVQKICGLNIKIKLSTKYIKYFKKILNVKKIIM